MKIRRTVVLATVNLSVALALTACGWGAGSSPTATMKEFNKAMKQKDKEALKKTLSKSSLQTIEVESKLGDETLDDAIQASLDKAPVDLPLPEMRNEVIKGNTATVEVKDEQKKLWFPVSFVKEDEQWKIAYDKAMRDPSHKMHGKPFYDAMPDK